MGRRRATEPLPDVAVVQASFRVRQDGRIIRSSTGEPATFSGPGGRVMVRVYHDGKIRRLIAARAAWAIAVGEWPHGIVRHRDGDEHNFSADNLLLVRRGHNPFSTGTSSLKRRGEVDSTLIRTLAEHPGATLPQLSQLVGATTSCCCTRLKRMENGGLTCSPKCQARLRWDLTPQGQALLAAAIPLPLDDRDRGILAALARSPMRQLQVVRAVGCCSLTAKRRLALLVERSLVVRDARNRYAATDQGRQALGDDATQRPEPWVRPELVSAANARDVRERGDDDRTRLQKSQHASNARLKVVATAKLRKRQALASDEWSLTG